MYTKYMQLSSPVMPVLVMIISQIPSVPKLEPGRGQWTCGNSERGGNIKLDY